MGTRVDFYVGRGEGAEWLGSYPFDGFPDHVFEGHDEMFVDPLPTEAEFRQWFARWIAEKGDRGTLPEQGWPWPWENSQTTDYAYAWEDGAIYGSHFGHRWFRVDPTALYHGEDEDPTSDKSAVFPDMSDRRAVTYGPRSGLIVLGLPTD